MTLVGKRTLSSSSRILGLAFCASLAASGCEHGEQGQPALAPTAPPPSPAAAPGTPGAPGASQSAALSNPAAQPLPPPVIVRDAGFKTPESVYYDAERDVYLVSNINGKPTDADKNGFISRVSPDGKVLDLKWIDGSKAATPLNAPKGMTIADGMLFVADITTIKIFDAKTGAPRGRMGVPGATFLNDVATAPDGKTFYVSDSGLKMKGDSFEPTGSDGVFRIGTRREAEPLIRGKELNGPNGLVADDKGVWVVTFNSNELYYVSKDGKKKEQVQTLPGGGLDGIQKLADGSLLVTSWHAKTIYKGTPGGTFTPLVTGLDGPADIGYDSKRNRLLVPRFTGDQIEIHTLGPAPAAPPAGAPGAVTAPAAPPGHGQHAPQSVPNASAPGASPGAAPPAGPPQHPAHPAHPQHPHGGPPGQKAGPHSAPPPGHKAGPNSASTPAPAQPKPPAAPAAPVNPTAPAAPIPPAKPSSPVAPPVAGNPGPAKPPAGAAKPPATPPTPPATTPPAPGAKPPAAPPTPPAATPPAPGAKPPAAPSKPAPGGGAPGAGPGATPPAPPKAPPAAAPGKPSGAAGAPAK